MNKLFTSSGYVDAAAFSAANGFDIDFATLPPFLRVLLTTDGTVTKSLESFFWEPVSVINLGQRYIELEGAEPVLGLEMGASVLHRQVKLAGTKSARTFTHATSLIRSEILAANIRDDLERGKVGVGELLRELNLETYRELVEFGASDNQQMVWRRYRIIMNHEPFIQITEEFPLAIFI